MSKDWSFYDQFYVSITLIIITFTIKYLSDRDDEDIVIKYIKSTKFYNWFKDINISSINYRNRKLEEKIGVKYVTTYNYPIINGVNSDYYDDNIIRSDKNFCKDNIESYKLYISKQNECTEKYFNDNIKDKEEFFEQKLLEIDYEDILPPFQVNSKFFFLKKNSIYELSYCLYKSDNLDNESELLIQPPINHIIR